MVYNDITKTDNIFKRKDDLICFILHEYDWKCDQYQWINYGNK